MPRAKRNKLVSLTKTHKDVHGLKDSLLQRVRSYVGSFASVYVITYQNMTTNPFKALREQLSDCRFCLGKNKVMGVALGRDEKESFVPNLFQLSALLKAQCCLFFTNKPHAEVKRIFGDFEVQEYAQVGSIADSTVILEKGFETLARFPHSMESQFRQLGLNIRLVNSKIELLENYLLSAEGKPLTVNNCKLLVSRGLLRNCWASSRASSASASGPCTAPRPTRSPSSDLNCPCMSKTLPFYIANTSYLVANSDPFSPEVVPPAEDLQVESVRAQLLQNLVRFGGLLALASPLTEDYIAFDAPLKPRHLFRVALDPDETALLGVLQVETMALGDFAINCLLDPGDLVDQLVPPLLHEVN